MTTHLFFPESQWRAWLAAGAARCSDGGGILTDPSTRAASEYALEPAVHVTVYLGNDRGELDRDPHALAGRVVTLASLAPLHPVLDEDTLRIGNAHYAAVRGQFAVAKDADVDHERVLAELSGRFADVEARS